MILHIGKYGWLSLVDPTLAVFIVRGPVQFLVQKGPMART